MRFISPGIHNILDFAAAAALIIAPFVLGFKGLALWLSVVGGIGLVVYSLFTDYQSQQSKVLPYKIHMMLDSAASVLFLVAPFIFGFSGVTAIYYWIMGGGVVLVILFSSTSNGAASGS